MIKSGHLFEHLAKRSGVPPLLREALLNPLLASIQSLTAPGIFVSLHPRKKDLVFHLILSGQSIKLGVSLTRACLVSTPMGLTGRSRKQTSLSSSCF